VRIVRAAGSLSAMTALALLQTSPALADGPPIPPPVTHTVSHHAHPRPHHVPRLPADTPARTTLTVVRPAPAPAHKPVVKPVFKPAFKPAAKPVGAVILVDPPAAFPGASVLLRVASGCAAPTTADSAAFTAPAPLTTGPGPGLTGSARVDSAAGAGIHTVTALCAGGVRATGVLRVLSPAQLGAVHAGGGWGADRLSLSDRPGRAVRPGWADRPIDTAIGAGLALAGFLVAILARQRSRAHSSGRTDA